MSAKAHGNKVDAKKSDVEILLAEAGHEDPAKAPKVLQVVCEQIAERGPRSIQAAVQYRQLTSSREAVSVGNVRPGDVCPMCHQYVMVGLQLSEEQMEDVLVSADKCNVYSPASMG